MKRLIGAGVAALAFVGLAGSALGASLPAGVQADRAVQQEATADIVDTAIAAGNFDTLVAAVQAAGLEETLRGEGPFTVFAPTDAAFAALPAGTIESLLADPSGALTDILLYHVVAGAVPAADVVGLTSATTVGGESISIAIVDGQVVLNDSVQVVTTDIAASNGIIHVIDGVLLPPAADGSPSPADTGNAGLMSGSTSLWIALGVLMAALVVIGGARMVTARQRA